MVYADHCADAVDRPLICGLKYELPMVRMRFVQFIIQVNILHGYFLSSVFYSVHIQVGML